MSFDITLMTSLHTSASCLLSGARVTSTASVPLTAYWGWVSGGLTTTAPSPEMMVVVFIFIRWPRAWVGVSTRDAEDTLSRDPRLTRATRDRSRSDLARPGPGLSCLRSWEADLCFHLASMSSSLLVSGSWAPEILLRSP